MRLTLRITSVLTIGLLTGCINPYPLPINEPTEEDSVLPPKVDLAPDGRKVASDRDSRAARPDRPGALASALAKPETQDDLKLNLLIYRDHYLKAHNDLTNANNATKDLTVGGGVIGVIGGLIESTTTVYTGGAIAAGSSIYGQRYQFAIQSENYRKASNTMDCMLGVVAPLSDSSMLSRAGITKAAAAIEEVRRKLYLAQSAVVLKDPDLDQLKAALIKETDADNTLTAARTSKTAAAFAVGSNLAPAEEALVLARLSECEKSF